MRTHTWVTITSFIVIVVLTLAVAPVFSQDASVGKANIQKMYIDYLTEEGYMPKIDSDGDVLFKREGNPYYIIIDENDPMYFSVARPNFWLIDSKEELLKVMLAAGYTNSIARACKIFTVNMTTWATVQILVASPEDLKNAFKHSLPVIDNGVATFAGLMRQKPNPESTLTVIPRIRD